MMVLEVDDGEILVHYTPPNAGPSVGGYLGAVGPGGHFKGIRYERLRELGSGRHDVPVAETATSRRGEVPLETTEDDALFRRLRHVLFHYEVGARVAREVGDAATRAMTPGNRDRVESLLASERWRGAYRDALAYLIRSEKV